MVGNLNQLLKFSDLKPIRRPERSWSQSQKIRVLVFLWHYCIPSSEDKRLQIFSEYHNGQLATGLSDKKHGKGSIVRSLRTVEICQWPELETQLFKRFLEQPGKGQAIRRGILPGVFSASYIHILH